ncbi:MerR family transcriptional regulator [Saccharothrix sp. ALI-22-I]|uniref:MerR family transcriptional regulator n=1 Tax=Saccharothrix sp. ALI-22-I TaxID=1933778 RepID=UPI00117ADCC4|nr:MerR family transcriptional regulator [Saccharothrix sp. ALI-22-I]
MAEPAGQHDRDCPGRIWSAMLRLMMGAPMKVSELARATGVPIPTIKYYLREGMLAPGRRTSVNRAWYDHGHVRGCG